MKDETLLNNLETLSPTEVNDWCFFEGNYYVKKTSNVYNNESYTFNDGSAIEQNKEYWFKCEPIVWNILTDENDAFVAKEVAKANGVFTARNDIFLDNSTDVEAIRMQIYKAMEMAEKHGDAVAICHARPNTARCWKQYRDEFVETGINFVPITELLY